MLLTAQTNASTQRNKVSTKIDEMYEMDSNKNCNRVQKVILI